MGRRSLDTIVIGFHETPLPLAFGRRPADDPLGFYYRTAFLRMAGRDVEPHVALSRLVNRATGRNGYYHWSETAPLALHHLTAFLRARGFDVEMVRFLDAEHERLAELLARGSLSVCIPTTFYMDPLPILDTIAFVRRHDPNVRIIVGGPFVQDLFHEQTGEPLARALEVLGGDVFVRGPNGDKTLARILGRLREGRDLGGVPSLAVLERGKLVGTSEPDSQNDETECRVDWQLLSDDELGKTVNLRTSLSCPFACAFCEFPVRAGRHRVADPAQVEEQLQVLERRGVRHVCFVDDTFNVPLPRFEQICRMLAAKAGRLRWSAHFRASGAGRPGLFRLMRDSGCDALHLGIESGDERMLELMDKTSTLEQYEHSLAECEKYEILTHAALVIGFPGENAESVDNTIRFVNRTRPTTFKAQPFFYHHHAPVHRRAREHGLSGKAWHWRHSTMTSREAMRAAAHVRASVTESCSVGDRQMHIFMLPWLLSKGMRRSELREALRLFDRIQRHSFDHAHGAAWIGAERAGWIEQLTQLCGRMQLEPAQFSIDAVEKYPFDLAGAASKRRAFYANESLERGMQGRRLAEPNA